MNLSQNKGTVSQYIVMEFVDGRTLRSVIAKDNSLETLFTLGAQMARALEFAAGV
jgi:tRNA A-37 threonylcarbamoyl transferase component Bud32